MKALAHPMRFDILRALVRGERNVGEIEDATGIGQPSLSQQLAVLRNAGLVETRREAKLVFYRLRQEQLKRLSEAIAGLIDLPPPAAPRTRLVSPAAANFAKLT
nr:metalloregulator ArsR/SmtB family transcription factor [Pacificimonas flava]